MSKTKILLVDNDADFLETRREFLEREGYDVISAFSRFDAKGKIEQKEVDLALIDIRLLNDDDEKDISGLELAKEVGHALPVIILTGYHSEDYMRQALRLQFDGTRIAYDFLAKELGPVAMTSAIRRTLEIFRQSNSNGLAAHAYPILRKHIRRLLPFEGGEHKFSSSPTFVKLDVPEQMLKDYELARLHARWIGWARLSLVIGGVLVFLFGVVMVILGNRDVGIIEAITGMITGTVGGLITKFANDANRRWEQFHKELIFFYKETTKKKKGGR
jgi:CheY-like chemotaxis protein